MGYGNSYGKGDDHSYGGKSGGKGKDYSYGGKDGGKSKDSSYGGKGWSGGYDGGGGGGGYDGGKGSSGGSWKGKPLAALPTDPNEQFEMMQWMQGTLDQMKVAKGIGKVAPSGKGDSYGKGGSGGKDGKSKDGKSKGGKDSKGGGGFKKTKLCTLHEAGYCGRHHCTFAHGEEQMGQLQPAEGFNAAHASGTLPSGHAVQVWSAKGGGKDHAAKSMGSFVGSTFGKGKRKGGDGPKPHKFMPWKLRLSNAYQGRHRKCPAKDTIQYETVQDGESYTCTVRCEDFTLSHDAGPGFASKKEAEEAAAKAAVEHEFPEWLEKMAAEASGKPAPDKLKKKQSWKTRLHQAFTKEHNESPQQSIEYTVEEREGGFIASVTCDRFVNSYVIDEIQSSRTLAQELAAKMALEGEFPSFALADALENDAEEAQTGGLSIPPPQKKAKYEKAEAGQGSVRHPNFPLDTKCQLNEGVMIILGRSVLKGDVEYNTTEQGGMTIASVTLSCLDPMQTFSGEGVSSFDPNSKRLAHKNAAEAALATLQEMIDAKRPEHEAMKQAKRAAQSNKQGQKRAADGEQLG